MGSTVNAVRLPGNEGLALAGPNGHTLYLFDNNHGTTSACAAACQQVWPPLVASATPTAGPGLDTAELTTGPSGQVMYNNNLLFDYSGDKAPGDANGFGIPGWHIVSPRGTGMTTK
jgi:predicted lipoprotein with Yx(FWY)xxD motif